MISDFELVKTIIEVIVIPMAGFLMRKMDKSIDDLRTEIAALAETQSKQNTELAVLRVALIGIDGRNGIRSEVAKLQANNHT